MKLNDFYHESAKSRRHEIDFLVLLVFRVFVAIFLFRFSLAPALTTPFDNLKFHRSTCLFFHFLPAAQQTWWSVCVRSEMPSK